VPRKTPAGWKLVALNIFIAAHLLGLFAWGFPDSRPSYQVAKHYSPYFRYVGLWHVWNMFSGATTVQMDLRAQVHYRDGSTALWVAPRMQDLSMWERIPKERYRKWREQMFHDVHSPAWTAAARYVARQMLRNNANPPVRVALIRHWANTAPAQEKSDYQPLCRNFDYGREATNAYIYSVTVINKSDLGLSRK